MGYEGNESADAAVDRLDTFVQWIDDPHDKLDLFYDVYRKILRQIVRETLDRMGEAASKSLLICYQHCLKR